MFIAHLPAFWNPWNFRSQRALRVPKKQFGTPASNAERPEKVN
jgi:hypothetical protein